MVYFRLKKYIFELSFGMPKQYTTVFPKKQFFSYIMGKFL